MNPAPAAPWRRLLPLAAGVLAVHFVVLQGGPEQLTPMREAALRFSTRTVTPPAAAVIAPPAAPAPAPPAAREPAAAQAPAPAPAPRRASAPAARPAAEPQGPVPRASSAQTPTAPETTAASPFIPQLAAVPAPTRMRYDVTLHTHGLSFSGRAQFDWKHDGQEYEARLEVAGPGFRTRSQRSTGRITADGLAPGYFLDKSRSEQATHFDREKGRIVFSNNRPQAALTDGIQDRLSVVVQLAMLVGGQPARFPAGTQIAIPTASTREADTWIFNVEGEEELDLPGGKVPALKLQRLPRRDYDQKLELWLAPRMDYAPVRLRLTNPDGGTVDQRWSSTDKG
jgi:hypothetical protein